MIQPPNTIVVSAIGGEFEVIRYWYTVPLPGDTVKVAVKKDKKSYLAKVSKRGFVETQSGEMCILLLVDVTETEDFK